MKKLKKLSTILKWIRILYYVVNIWISYFVITNILIFVKLDLLHATLLLLVFFGLIHLAVKIRNKKSKNFSQTYWWRIYLVLTVIFILLKYCFQFLRYLFIKY